MNHGPVLVIAAHPDDEALGCGGTIASLTSRGIPVHVALLADGQTSRSNHQGLTHHHQCALGAGQRLGTETTDLFSLPDNRMDSIALLEIAKVVESLVEKYQPRTVMTHHAGDLNIDHRLTHQAVVTACRPQKGHPVKTILFFEVTSSTEWQPPGMFPPFEPNWFIDISGTLKTKMAALEIYSHEMREWPHPRSMRGVETLAHWRGATVGVDAAEAFILGRNLQ